MRLSDKIRSHDAHVAVMGQGYVGLPLATEFAKAGFSGYADQWNDRLLTSQGRGAVDSKDC